MNQHPFYNKSDEYEWSGPRPPVPGEESRRPAMIEGHQPDLLPPPLPLRERESPPACLKWANKLSNLLEDRDGVELFKKYVEQGGGIHVDRLNFYFACEGLKQQSDPEKVKQIIGAIYRFLRKSQLDVPDDIRKIVKAGLKNELLLTPDVYDQMQCDVERIINETTYPNFLQSEIYIQAIQNVNISSQTSSSSTSESASKLLSRSSTLPTLHEDSEFITSELEMGLMTATGTTSGGIPMALTRDALMATQKRRLELRPSGNRTQGFSVYTSYASYNPVSQRNSELASLSSGRTDSDTMSLSSVSTDGRQHAQRRHHRSSTSMEKKLMRENVLANEDTMAHAMVIPRTQRLDAKKNHTLLPMDMMKILMPKLEALQREQANDEILSKKLNEAQSDDKSKSNKSLADAIREKFQVDDDNDQDILDQHVSRVWSDLTPSRSPGTSSPCPTNLNSRRRTYDLGFGPAPGLTIAQIAMRHSKSMPENQAVTGVGSTSAAAVAAAAATTQANRKLLNNKWPSVNTDSGISLYSSDTLSKYKDPSSSSSTSSRQYSRSICQTDLPGMSTSSQLEETRRRLLEDETRRSRRYSHNNPPPPLPPPHLPSTSSNIIISSSSSSNILMGPPPAVPAKPLQQQLQQLQQSQLGFTTVVYSFCDEEVPYRIKIPGSHPPTLKQFKDYLPKKGNYRFFFKTRCDDADNPVIQEEINNDLDILPLFEGKVMGTVKERRV